jgi:hypothetical protein
MSETVIYHTVQMRISGVKEDGKSFFPVYVLGRGGRLFECHHLSSSL